MTSKSFAKPLSVLDARFEAQKIAFGPVVFQCVRIAWRWGLLQRIDQAPEGLTVEQLANAASPYAVRILLESCLSAGVVSLVEDRYRLEKIGKLVVHDALTQVNLNFVHEVCYRGLHELEATLQRGTPEGLAGFGPWATIYEGLSALPEPARNAWFAYDHFYSDSAFRQVLPLVFASAPAHVMDIGANTGRFARQCLAYDPAVRVTLVDLPGQLALARADLGPDVDRVVLHAADMLDSTQEFPRGQDLVWMSQFLTCFDLDSGRDILARARRSVGDEGQLLILDTFWDRQALDIAAFCVINTSPYFAALANGRSKMYESRETIGCARDSGWRLVDIRDGIGLSHSLLRFVAA